MALNKIPLELTGKLDPSKSWDVKFIFNGEEKIVSVPEDSSVLEIAEKNFDGVDSSCRNGVCTTCAGLVVEGKDSFLMAVHGLGEPQLDVGFVCTCQTYVTGPGVVVKLGMYDQVYESQYGQFEKSYGEIKFDTTRVPAQEEKKKGWW
jgi:ferredoxin